MSLINKLNRMKKNIIREEQQIEGRSPTESAENSIWAEHGMTVFTYENQSCLIKEVEYPLDYKHGHYSLGEFHKVVRLWNQSHSTHPLSSKGHESHELFFFDTETTGLGGGVGNTIFLLGQAQVLEDKVVVRQYLLPQPGNEVALYSSFLEKVNSKTLVTYNGKAFDWPQVKTRHTLIKERVPKLPPFGHFDLFHAARRLWKNDLDSVRLANVESEILGIKREDDVPGFLAPMIYFQFVKQQRPEIILGVLKHNEIDVLSLITLYTHLSLKLLNTNLEATENEHYEIARWLDYVGDDETAIDAYEALLNKGKQNEDKTYLALGAKYKKRKDYHKATVAWEKVAKFNIPQTSSIAAIELAKYYEHKEKNVEKAIHFTQLVLNYIRENRDIPFNKEDIERRMDRLEKKSNRNIARASAGTEEFRQKQAKS
ncbi:ribonuclease H-like domain-containing protein [Bacillus weihaiensis]|uniref:YprB ribonuclease H-like domain-containing protein n=1 Tax=Bacillus weihaiensis TaxID=1547283 RepID=A0A1L3MXE8_9BACI|nr:ribonuclease H-like domain-containing protein [Bacillus weihaiensis]APH07006.1 hypothetical protein A9C19_07765 [Bacillus weihaiensis]